MANVAETLISDYMKRRASESKQGTMDMLGSLGSTAAPTNYGVNANNFIGGFNQGMSNLIKFAQTGDRRRAEAAEQSRMDEQTAYNRERQAALDAIASRTSDLAHHQFTYKKDRDLKADQLLKEKDLAAARTAQAQLEYMGYEEDYRKKLEEAEPLMNQAMNYGLLKSNTGSGLILNQLDKDSIQNTYDTYAQAVRDGGNGVAPLGFDDWKAKVGAVATELGPRLENIRDRQKGLQKLRDDFTKSKLQGASTLDPSDDYAGNIQSIVREGDIARSKELQERIAMLDNRAKAITDKVGSDTNLSTEYEDWKSKNRDSEDRIETASRQYDDGDDNATSKEFSAQTRETIRLLANNPIVAGLSPLQLEYLAIKGTQDAVREGNKDPTYFGNIEAETALKRTKYYIKEFNVQSQLAQDTKRQLININDTKATLKALKNQYGDIHSPMTKN